jgi:hypothetical protein
MDLAFLGFGPFHEGHGERSGADKLDRGSSGQFHYAYSLSFRRKFPALGGRLIE